MALTSSMTVERELQIVSFLAPSFSVADQKIFEDSIQPDHLQEDWLEILSDHPIFHSSNPSNQSHQHLTSIINQTILLVYIDSQIRSISLSKFKSSSSSNHFNILRPIPSNLLPSNPVVQLIPNFNSKLLAVQSQNKLSVISLPRFDHQHLSNQFLDCQINSIGHPSTHDLIINKVIWHHWSHLHSTILILYSNSIIYEFDCSFNTQVPTQTIDFNYLSPIQDSLIFHHPTNNQIDSINHFQNLDISSNQSSPSPKHINSVKKKPHSGSSSPSKINQNPNHSKPGGTYGNIHSSDFDAVSICLGTGSGDWGPLTLYCIMQNGDLYAICPYLPKNYLIPLSYKSSLLFFLSTKLQAISKSNQINSNNHNHNSIPIDLQEPLYQSLNYLNSLNNLFESNLNDQIEPLNFSHHDEKSFTANQSSNLPSNLKPLRQGPFLLQPSPIDFNLDQEEIVSDLIHFRYSSLNHTFDPPDLNQIISQSNQASSLGLFIIAYQSKLDICLEVEKIEPCWNSNHLSNLAANSNLPTLITYESINLNLSSSNLPLNPNLHTSLKLLHDLRYSDTFYVYNQFGLHTISILNWIEPLMDCLSNLNSSPNQSDLTNLIRQKIPSQVVMLLQTFNQQDSFQKFSSSCYDQPNIDCLSIYQDPYLGYGLFVITSDNQFIPLQLQPRPLTLPISFIQSDLSKSLPPTNRLSPSSTQNSNQASQLNPSNNHSSYIALIGHQPWKIPPLLTQKPSQIIIPKLKQPPNLSAINSTTIKYLVDLTTAIDHHIRKVIESINEGQDRLKLQFKEYERQIHHLYQAHDQLLNQNGKSQNSFENQLIRIRRVEETQNKLLQRADLLLQKLTDDNNQSLSKEEIKWFEELKRMKSEIHDQQNGNQKSLLNQINDLKIRLDLIKTSTTNSPNKLNHFTSESNLCKSKLGDKQVSNIQNKLIQAASCIGLLKEQISRLSATLSHPS
ncbi:hypothetical protein O181_018790 [Austropuccinia psidii MF-1]|uniref:Nucleoporin Nup88 n=1 Tax=Austropuccinia psidii MF-1 TaxID=1389203 RepID=A0A9Q3C9C8_9BASI|nr:hypothetical protein [Austropuccinia psidii MF-1]